MTVGMHLCRGNLRSSWMARGGYDPVANILFNKIKVDALFLEYDDDRAGSFEPLKAMNANEGPFVVLGLITTKSGVLEDRDAIKRRVPKRPMSSGWTVCVSVRNAVSPPRRKAICSPKQSNGEKLALTQEIAAEVWN